VVALNNPVVHFWPSAAGTQGRNYLHGILSQQGNLNPGLVTQDDEEPDSRPPVNEKGTMRDEKRSFVLIVGADRVVATTLAGVLHAGGYMAGTTASSETMLRIASRMVIDAAVIEVAAKTRAIWKPRLRCRSDIRLAEFCCSVAARKRTTSPSGQRKQDWIAKSWFGPSAGRNCWPKCLPQTSCSRHILCRDDCCTPPKHL